MAVSEPWRQGVERIVADRDRGASLLAADALQLLEEAAHATASDDADGIARLVDAARSLRAARPSMPVISNLVNLAMHEASQATTLADVVLRAGHAARDARQRALQARGIAAREAASLLRGTVVTHSASETVTKALHAAARAGTIARIVVAEGRPRLEGRQTARALAADGVDVVLIVDAALGLHAREADVALVGADAVLPDGALVNKVGTRLLALACERAQTPLYSAADRFKVSPTASLPLEEKEAEEVWPDAPAGVQVRNIYFDRTEAALVSGHVTDMGVLAPHEVASVAKEHATWSGWEARLRGMLRDA